jgi:steroid 5-alpha reductase family enzyme
VDQLMVWINSGIMLGVAIGLIALTFGAALLRHRYDTIDSVWGLGFAVIALVTFGISNGNLLARIVITALTVVWGLRLAIHIHTRNHGHAEDPRYAAMVAKAGATPRRRMFLRVYLLQAALMWVISFPVQAGQYSSNGLNVFSWLGIVVWLVGLGFESVGDAQLRRFRADPASAGRVLDTGLWRYTRHPNYFGDACVWWGLYLLACRDWVGVATIFAPLVMTGLLAKGSGQPLLEKSLLKRRPGYADYIRRTSGFFPLPPRRAARSSQEV